MECSQPVEVEGNGGKEGIWSDGLPMKIAAPRDMEAVFVCKTQIGGGLFGGMPGVKALNPIQPRVLQCTEDFLQAPVGAAELAGMGQNRLPPASWMAAMHSGAPAFHRSMRWYSSVSR